MKQLVAYIENGKWGYRDEKTNEILIPAKYDEVAHSSTFSSPKRGSIEIFYTFFVKKEDQWQLVDRKNRLKNPHFYDEIDLYCGFHICGVLQNGKWSFIYINGQEASSLRVDDFNWKPPFLQIKINDKWGVLNWKMEDVLFS